MAGGRPSGERVRRSGCDQRELPDGLATPPSRDIQSGFWVAFPASLLYRPLASRAGNSAVRVPSSHGGSREFESLSAHQKESGLRFLRQPFFDPRRRVGSCPKGLCRCVRPTGGHRQDTGDPNRRQAGMNNDRRRGSAHSKFKPKPGAGHAAAAERTGRPTDSPGFTAATDHE